MFTPGKVGISILVCTFKGKDDKQGDYMPTAAVLIYCQPGKYQSVLEKVRKIEGVRRAFPVLGRCDIIAEVEAEDLRVISDISFKIATLSGVRSTETLLEMLL